MAEIWQGYASFDVPYHNDYHAFDVTQLTYMLVYGKADG